MFGIFRNSLDDFKLSFSKYLLFELFYTFLASMLVIPFLTYIFNRVFLLLGKGEAILNSDVYQLGLSFDGIISTFTISILAVAVLFIEFGVLIIICQKSYFRKPVSIAQAFNTSLKRLPKLLGLGIFQLFFLMLLSIPFLDASTLPPLLDLNTDIIITELWQRSLFAKFLYITVLISIIYVYIRWIYALHFIFIENKPIAKAMSASWRLTKHRKFRLVVSLVLLNIVITIAGFLMVTLLSELASLIESKAFGDFIGNYLLLFSSYATIILSLFIIPINLIMLTRLYYDARKAQGLSLQDPLSLEKSNVLGRLEEKMARLIKRNRKAVWFTSIICTVGIVLISGFIQTSIVYLPWNVEVASHKGDGFHSPENSIAAVESAINKGIEVVEIDVTLTKDDKLILSHDQNLNRISGIEADIKDLTYDELKEIDIGRSFDEAYAGETIPTLEEILAITSEANTGIIIDVKADDKEEVYAQEIARLVEKYDQEELAYVQSFNYTFLKKMREQNADIDIGQILYIYAGNLSSLDVDFYTVRETMLTKRFIDHAKKENRQVWVWTVNSKRNIKKVLSYDIDGIITDYPERVQRIIGIQAELEEGSKK